MREPEERDPARIGGAIHFGQFCLDSSSGRLMRGQTNVPLRRKTFAVLEHLANRPGQLVEKAELLDAIWPDTHVAPCVLTGCIRELRQALGDDARAARFVETAYRRGYRFIADTGRMPAGTRRLHASTYDAALLPDRELAHLARWFAGVVGQLIGRAAQARPGGRIALSVARPPARRRRRTSAGKRG